ncbi:UDP-glucuronosyl and UDP-glucosyl transferase [Handroanthus impetiginosus]|uniref:Glycosyltransferase n=1 Tax=Handroanthus impetiginosus TaxID=429701 RepID=A0A2G9H4N0_9LAMI|nr:UDP-glucuronosyl and UDP-glucosyl transferase [Handroanthus impetiginosus]
MRRQSRRLKNSHEMQTPVESFNRHVCLSVSGGYELLPKPLRSTSWRCRPDDQLGSGFRTILAEKLLHHGFRVSFLLITTQATAAQTQFFQSPAAVLPDLTIINLPPADVSNILTDEMRILTQLSIITRESLKPLKSILVALNPEAIIIDIFTSDAIEVCREISIPVYSFFTASTVLLTFSLYLPTLDREVDGEFVELPAPIEIPGCRAMRTEDILDQIVNVMHLTDRKNDEYKWYLLHVSRLRYAVGIFLNAWEDLDPDRIKALRENPFFKNIPIPPVYPIGPLIEKGESLTEQDAKILTWLDNQPSESVLFVCLGSAGTLSSKQLGELALGIEMSGQRFIMVVRPPTDARADSMFFTVGRDENDPSAYMPDGFLERTRGVGLVVATWAPQLVLLRHPSTGAFLSHCGWNSTLESLVEGVPMIAWPLYAEQRMNAAMLVEEAGVAVNVKPEERGVVVGREVVKRVVTAVMEGEEGKRIRRRARELKESARIALENGGPSEISLLRFLNIWKCVN